MVALEVLGFLVFILNYCWGGGFKNFTTFKNLGISSFFFFGFDVMATLPPHESLSCLVSLYFSFPPLSYTHSYNMFHFVKEKMESAECPEDAKRRTGSFRVPALKTNCDKVSVRNESVEIGSGMLDYLLCSAPTYRERNY